MPSEKQKTRGYPLPAQITGHDLLCLSLKVPDNPEYLAALYGAITELGKWWNWEKTGGTEGTQAASYWRQLIYDHLTIGDCEPVSNPIPAGLAVGMVIPYAGVLPLPDGLLLMDGTTRNAVDYPELWDVLNPTFKNTINNTFTLPNMTERTVIGTVNQDPPPIGYYIGMTGGSATVTLTESQLPPHTHPVRKRDNANFGGSGFSASSNFTGTETTSATNSTGGGAPHPNMPPYLALFYVVVAKTITGGEPREIVMDSEILPDGECKKLYWRYSDEAISSNRYLATVCDGDEGEPGAPGTTPDCPDCPDDNEVPEPDPTEIPENENPRCLAATAMMMYIKNAMTDTLEEISAGGDTVSALGAFGAILGIIFTAGWAVILGAVAALVGSLFSLISSGGEVLIDDDDWEQLKCILLCHLDIDGRIDEAGVAAVVAECYALMPVKFEWEFIGNTVEIFGVTGLNNAAKSLIVTEGDCDDCSCGNCYHYFGTDPGVVYYSLDQYVVSEPTSVGTAAMGSGNLLDFAGNLSTGQRAQVRLKIPTGENAIITYFKLIVSSVDFEGGGYTKKVTDVTNGAILFNQTSHATADITVEQFDLNTREILVEWQGSTSGRIRELIFETTLPLDNKTENC